MLEYIGNGVFIGLFLFHLLTWLCCVFAVYKQAASFLVFYRGVYASLASTRWTVFTAYMQYPHARKFLLTTCLAVWCMMTVILLQALLAMFLLPELVDRVLGSLFPFLFYLAMALQLYTSSIRYEHLCIDIKHSSKIKKRVWFTRWIVLVVCGVSGISGTIKEYYKNKELVILNNVADYVGLFMNLAALGIDAFMNISMIKESLRTNDDPLPLDHKSIKSNQSKATAYSQVDESHRKSIKDKLHSRWSVLIKSRPSPIQTHYRRTLYSTLTSIITIDVIALVWFGGILLGILPLDTRAKPQNVAVSMILFHCLGCLYLLETLREKVILAKMEPNLAHSPIPTSAQYTTEQFDEGLLSEKQVEREISAMYSSN